jgi:hypothetical protein
MVAYDGCPTIGGMLLWGKLSVILGASEVDILAAISVPCGGHVAERNVCVFVSY